ncbi:hypothetical protein HCN44_002771 [Aphidius gifuensis]|uniref:Aminopeptidase n=1 Tax=Aphidius gifuensis TaxID=684658 RepID=A0A834XU01_APHGI|nr:glutamyl aminopeptidase-like [Aphidius gifuensis]KAF7991209.1 hypothetical protein HCN44_002771 [Aphidius gifuensis]
MKGKRHMTSVEYDNDNNDHHQDVHDRSLTPHQRHIIKQTKLTSNLFGCVCCCCVFLTFICFITISLLVVFHSRGATATSLKEFNSEGFNKMSNKGAPETTFRLSKEVIPLHYDLYLYPNLDTGKFQGNVTILVEILEQRNYIALHQKDLKVTSAILKTRDIEDSYDINVKEILMIDKYEELVISFNNDIKIGIYLLTLEFNGTMEPDKIVGFYSSKYKDENNKIRKIATSKFEPTYARRGFPCFDEPSFKAEFTIKLVHPSGDCYSALSSMNIESTLVDKPHKGLTTVTFARSVPMSTYLICFIVSDFVSVTGKAKKLDDINTFPLSVYTTRQHRDKALFSLDVGIKIIQWYTNIFKIDYPLPKLDMAAIPDFVSGAMENWGLITYREARLLYDENTSSTADKESVVQVIAHEFAHMWFGNLVTMKWWNDLWLNEGFASYMQYKSANAIMPDWGVMDRFLPETLHGVLITDSKISSHPIVQSVNNPDEITAIFDSITYSKGASVLRMLNNFIGNEIFNNGITKYLNKYAYKNAETSDLFSILQNEPNVRVNITSIMDTWTRQMGYPVVNIKKINSTHYTLKQKRFLADSEAKYDANESDYGYKWTIPITYITDKISDPTLIWFDKDSDKIDVILNEPAEWIKFNCDQIGYYRVNYDDKEWEKLFDVLQWHHKRLSISDRTNIIEDAFSLAQASELDYTIAMKMTSYLGKEHSSVPWRVAAAKLLTIDDLLLSTNVSIKYRQYIRKLVEIPYHDVTWQIDNYEDHDTLRLRSTILNLACAVGHTECLDEAGAMFKAWIEDPRDTRPHPDIRSFIYKYGMSHVGKETEWNALLEKFINENSATEKLKLSDGLAGVQSTFLLNKFIGIAVDEKYVRSQDTFGCLLKIARNPIGTPLVWDWVRENWEFLVKRYTLNDRYLGQLVPGITSKFATELKLNEVKEFFNKYPEAGAGKSYRIMALETISNNIKWVKKNSDKLEKWLDANLN